MLDNETKRRIDTARDILVGKVPDPKSQVEQITIALVYKFMDDMDKESVEMGGKPSFFTGEFERYAWSKIFDPRIGGFEMLNLYGEAIVKLNQNPNIPQLFRDIFKNAYLPYRDPETLKLFLKTINEFTYDHSERLGDAFEYLLSVLGSQGDAGQFRTPRHIIDFMVQVINPQKNETILDPACGTAGFLISAYKHIIRENTSPKNRSENGNNRGDLLNTEERKKLLNNFKGFDISPDMVRLSLVNLYLHGFVQPKIFEYDTLTSEDRWNEYADVILANPPFMSPKGGIKPHKKFSVESNRSEVLFVDYIAEHMTPTGRAAVIVPEGIIFQSAGAYKQLRKMLIKNYLFGVVSLPAGLFNPYSSVKTSILLMDKTINKNVDHILFLKIENDGYGLGAQRREQSGSDIPDALNVITEYINASRSGMIENFKPEEKPCSTVLVKKEVLTLNEDYNLTGDRYRILESLDHQKWPKIELGELIDFVRGVTYSKEDECEDPESKIVLRANNIDLSSGKIIFTDLKRVSKILNFKDSQKLKKNDILICTASGSADHIGKVGLSNEDTSFYFGGFMGVIRTHLELDPLYLFYQLKNAKFRSFLIETSVGANIRNLNYSSFSTYKIPLPPLDVQRKIASEIETYQKLIDGARQVIVNWTPKVEIDPDWPLMMLGDVCDRVSNTIDPNANNGEVTYIGLENIEANTGNIVGSLLTQYEEIKSAKNQFQKGDILYGKLRPNLNKVYLADRPGICSTDIFVFRAKNNSIPEYLYVYFLSELFNQQVLMGLGGAQLPRVNFEYMSNLKIPLAPIEIQQEIVTKIESERKVIVGCKELIFQYEEKIKKLIEKVWEE